MNATDTLDMEAIRAEIEINPALQAACRKWAEMDRARKVTSVNEPFMKWLVDINSIEGPQYVLRTKAIALCRTLERLGAGELVEGRRKHPTRFVWSVNRVEFGKAAVGLSEDAPKRMSVDEDVEANQCDDEDRLDSNQEWPLYSFRLRPGIDLRLPVPEDLTADEATRIGVFYSSFVLAEEV